MPRQIESLPSASAGKVGASVHTSLRHLLLLLGSVFGWVESLAALLICGPGRHCTVHPAAIIRVLLLHWHKVRVPDASLLLGTQQLAPLGRVLSDVAQNLGKNALRLV